MNKFIKGIAAAEGWTDATTIGVLASVLQSLVEMGSADAEDLKALIKRHTSSSYEEDIPEMMDVVSMRSEDVEITIAEIPDEQPQAHIGIWSIVDENGDTHLIEREDETWYVIVPAL